LITEVEALAADFKFPVYHQYGTTTIRTLWTACTVTLTKDRWVGAYSFGLTIPGKISRPIKKKKEIDN
jgi:hypothetical protein